MTLFFTCDCYHCCLGEISRGSVGFSHVRRTLGLGLCQSFLNSRQCPCWHSGKEWRCCLRHLLEKKRGGGGNVYSVIIHNEMGGSMWWEMF